MKVMYNILDRLIEMVFGPPAPPVLPMPVMTRDRVLADIRMALGRLPNGEPVTPEMWTSQGYRRQSVLRALDTLQIRGYLVRVDPIKRGHYTYQNIKASLDK